LYQVRNLQRGKRKINGVNRRPTECKKILARYLPDRGLISKIYSELKKLNSKITYTPNHKWANEPGRYFSNDEVQMTNK
jgi:hypothetical protein